MEETERRKPNCGIDNCPATDVAEKIELLIVQQNSNQELMEEIKTMKASIGFIGKILITVWSAGPALAWCYSYFKEQTWPDAQGE